MPVGSAIMVPHAQEKRRLQLVREVHGGITDVSLRVFIQWNLHAFLPRFGVVCLRAAVVPVDLPVTGSQISQRPTSHRGRKQVALRGDKGSLVSAPGVANQ